jgi:hypothetical protein
MDAGNDACVPKSCAQQGFDCGSALDGCGNIIQCGATCPAGQTCGAQMPNVCGGVVCTPKSCAQQGFNCGSADDGCGNVIMCGTCPTGQSCGANAANVCGTSVTCTGLCTQQTMCAGTATTSISGSVFAPNGVDVLPGALVFVPNGALSQFQDGVASPHCSCGSDVTGNPLVSTITNFDGTFSITNMPVGANIPLVIQKGRWRREYIIPNVAACVNTAIPSSGAQQLRMPQKEAEFTPYDNIPRMGFVTGSVDALECVLRKIGIADNQFSDPSGTGRVRFYTGSGGPGSKYSASTPSETTLWGNQATIDQYDTVLFACQGDDYQKTAAQQQIVVNYANQGGRVFATHYSYVWLDNTAHNATWSPTAQWTQAEGAFAADPQTGYINTAAADPRPTTMAKWLQFIGASTTYGQMSIGTLRQDFAGVNSPSLLWINVDDTGTPPLLPGLGNVPLHYTFDTPWNVAPANQCGRVLYSDFHVEDATTSGTTFPAECTSPTMTPQEKMLEFMIFDLGSCVTPPVCQPKTCAQIGSTCGPQSDGCGNIIQCGSCGTNQTCVSGQCTTQTTCTPKTCAQLGFNCGNASDGCSNVINCGTCNSPLTCGGGGQSNVCGGQF